MMKICIHAMNKVVKSIINTYYPFIIGGSNIITQKSCE